MNLTERLMPRIGTVIEDIRHGLFDGLLSVAYAALEDGEITTAEHDALRETIDAYTTEHRAVYVVSHLVPEFDDMTYRRDEFGFPNAISERAATLWKEWAINLVSQVQETLNAQ